MPHFYFTPPIQINLGGPSQDKLLRDKAYYGAYILYEAYFGFHKGAQFLLATRAYTKGPNHVSYFSYVEVFFAKGGSWPTLYASPPSGVPKNF